MKMMMALILHVSSDYWSATEPLRGKKKNCWTESQIPEQKGPYIQPESKCFFYKEYISGPGKGETYPQPLSKSPADPGKRPPGDLWCQVLFTNTQICCQNCELTDVQGLKRYLAQKQQCSCVCYYYRLPDCYKYAYNYLQGAS